MLTRHLAKVAKHSQFNKMTASNLATCFGPTIFRAAEQDSVCNLYNIKFYSEIVETLIVYSEEMFQNRPLDPVFLRQLTPIRSTPVSMMSNLSSINTSANLSPLPPTSGSGGVSSSGRQKPTGTNASNSTIKRSGGPINEFLTYKNVLMNSSKASVSTSSDSSSDFQMNNSPSPNNLQHSMSAEAANTQSNLISSPISTSSPNSGAVNRSSALINNSSSTTPHLNKSASGVLVGRLNGTSNGTSIQQQQQSLNIPPVVITSSSSTNVTSTPPNSNNNNTSLTSHSSSNLLIGSHSLLSSASTSSSAKLTASSTSSSASSQKSATVNQYHQLNGTSSSRALTPVLSAAVITPPYGSTASSGVSSKIIHTSSPLNISSKR